MSLAMVAEKSTVEALRDVIPGQPDAWYERIAGEIVAGRMPMPTLPEPTPALPEPTPALPEPTTALPSIEINLNRDQPAAPKSKTKQLKKGTYRALQPKPNPTPRQTKPKPTSQPPSEPAGTAGGAIRQALKSKAKSQPASAKTKWKLESLVHGDKGAAARLAAQVAFAHPDKSEQWCWEKAIFDITRDRY